MGWHQPSTAPVDLADLGDVQLASPAAGDQLTFEANGKWENAVSGSVTAVGDVTVSSDTDASGSGDIVFKTGLIERFRIKASGIFVGLAARLLGWYVVTDGAYGATGDGVTDDLPSIQAAIDAASAAATSDGQRIKVLIPAGVYICNGELVLKDNVAIENRGHLKFTGGNAIGQFVAIRAVSNVEVYGGIWDSNSQTNDNTIAVSFLNADQTVAGAPCENIFIHDLLVKNSKHGGSHISDPNDPAYVGSGGGKGITVQFGCKKVLVDNVIVEDCDLGYSIEGRESSSGYSQDIVFSNVVVTGAKYMGMLLSSVVNTPSLYGQTTSVLLDNVEFVDCGVGQTTEASPRDVATLFGTITCNGMLGVMARNIRVRSTTGKLTVFRGSQRYGNWDVQVICGSGLIDVVNTSPYGGYNPTNIASRGLEMALDVIHAGTTAAFTGYLVNNNSTYPANYSTFRISAINLNNGTIAAVPTSQYTQNLPSESMLVLKDRFNGRFLIANDGSSVTGAISGIQTFINGVGFKDDSGSNLSKIAPTRSVLALADSSGATQARVESGKFTAQNILSLGTAVGDGTKFLEGYEQTADPSAPAANAGRLYFRDNGSGKTQLCVVFNTGAVQVIATQP